jgi:hypothetical protein
MAAIVSPYGPVVVPGLLKTIKYMREYLFRGKMKDNGNWAYGSFVTGGIFGGHKDDCYIFFHGRFFEVVPETIGQFIDRKDKDGNKIFDGDILLSHGQDGKELLTIVTWIPLNSRFEGSPIIGNGHWIDKGVYRNADLFSLFRVIGNTTDNPELVKPAVKDGFTNTMNNNYIDPNAKTEEAVSDVVEATPAEAPQDAEEGTTEG